MPSGEPTTPDERREADALLERLVTEPLTKPRRPRRARPLLRPRRLALAGALVAVLGTVTMVVADLIDSERGRNGVIERAVAAVSEEDVIYAVSERWRLATRQQKPGARTHHETGLRRYWLWPGGKRTRFLDYRATTDGTRGRLVSEFVDDGSRLRWWMADTNSIHVFDPSGDEDTEEPSSSDGDYPGFDPAFDPGDQLREHVDEGGLRVAGRTTLRGRKAYRLLSGRLSHPSPGTVWTRVVYWVDARTFLPLALRDRTLIDFDPGPREQVDLRIDYLRYERHSVTDANERLLGMSSHPGADRLP